MMDKQEFKEHLKEYYLNVVLDEIVLENLLSDIEEKYEPPGKRAQVNASNLKLSIGSASLDRNL